MTDLLLLGAVVAALIAANGLYVAAEFAIIGSRPSRLRELAQAGHPMAQHLSGIVRNPQRLDGYISTAQVGITLASLGLAMYAEEALAHLVEPALQYLAMPGITGGHLAASILALGVLTYLHIVVGEMIPKALALRNAEGTAFRVAIPMAISRVVFLPLVVPLTALGALVLRLLRVPNPGHRQRILSQDELGMVIAQSTAGGLLTAREGRMLLAIFQFSDREAHHVMTPRTRIDALSVDSTQAELETRLAHGRRMRYPAFEGDVDHVVGILHVKDYARWRLANDQPFDLRALLREPLVVPEHMSVQRLLDLFRREHAHLAVVIDEYGGTAGLVTLHDIAEAVIGEIRDEHDTAPATITTVRPGIMDVGGEVRLSDLLDHVALPPDAPAVDTLGGLVVTLLGRPAEVGDVVTIGGLVIRVDEIQGLAVRRARITTINNGAGPC